MATSIAKLAIHLTTETAGMVAGFARARGEVAAFSRSMGSLGALGRGGGLLGALGLGAAGGPLGLAVAGMTALAAGTAAVVTAGVRFSATMEQASVAMETMTGSAARGKQMLAELQQFAAKTPFEFAESREAATTLLAMGAAADDVMPQLQMIGDVASGTKQPLNELAQVFGQVMQAGRLTGNELRQFNERGVPLMKELEVMFGTNSAGVRAMTEASQISAAHVVEAFDRMSGAGGRFGGLMEKQSQTLAGQWARLKDNFMFLAGDIGADLVPALTEALRVVANILETVHAMRKELGATVSALTGWKIPSVEINKQRDSVKTNMADQRKEMVERAKAAQAAADAEKAAKEQAAKAAEEAKQRADYLKRAAESLTSSLRTPQEIFRDYILEARDLLAEGVISWETYGRAIQKASDELTGATNAKRQFDSAARTGVAAVTQGSAAGFSAVQEARRSFQLQQEAKRAAEIANRKAEEQRERIIGAIEKQRPITVRETRI